MADTYENNSLRISDFAVYIGFDITLMFILIKVCGTEFIENPFNFILLLITSFVISAGLLFVAENVDE